MGLLIAALAVAVLIWLLLLGLAKTAAAADRTHTTTTTVTTREVWVTPDMVTRLSGHRGPDELAAAWHELHDMAEWEEELS